MARRLGILPGMLLLLIVGCNQGIESAPTPISLTYNVAQVQRAEQESYRLRASAPRNSQYARVSYLWAKASGFCAGVHCVRLDINGSNLQDDVREISVVAVDGQGREFSLNKAEFGAEAYSLLVLQEIDAAVKRGP